jgi:hypothetical protein
MVLKRLNRTKNYVRHMVVFATWWSGTLRSKATNGNLAIGGGLPGSRSLN